MELLGKPVESLVPESIEQHHRELRRDYVRHAMARPMGGGRELAAKHRDGHQIPIEISLTPVVRGSDQFIVCTLVDVTERRRLQTQLQDVQKEVAVGNLVSGIAHDFNNILSGAIGYAELGKEQAGSNPDLQDTLNEILDVTQRGREFVARVLDAASNRASVRHPVHWEAVIEDAIRLMRLTLPANVRVQVRPGEPVPEVLADPVELQRTFVNLLTNAVNATAKNGGVIDIRLDVAPVKTRHLERRPNLDPGVYVRLSVIDEGVGMPATVLERVFEPHFTTRTKEGGRGIGLFVSSRIVRRLGGDVDISSEEGKGTRVDVYLPVLSDESRREQEPIEPKVAGGAGEESSRCAASEPLTC